MASRSDGGDKVALVTGADGFTGTYVVSALQRAGYRVHGWVHRDATGPDTSAVDLLDRAAVAASVQALQPDVVVHLAAISFVAHGDAGDIYGVNVVGSRNLLDALASIATPPEKVVLVSSANIYGNVGGTIAEDTPASPQNDYAVSKIAMEYMARLWQEKLPITVVRPFNYTGVGQSEKFLLPKIVSHFYRRAEVMELGNLDVSRDFYDVRCVAQAYVRLIAASDVRDVYNVCSGEEHTLRQVIEMMQRISGHSLEVRVNPAFVRANEVKTLRGDNRKLLSKIGPLPQFSLEDTLTWMYRNPEGGDGGRPSDGR